MPRLGKKGPYGPPAIELLLGAEDRLRITATLNELPEKIRGQNVSLLVDLVEASLMEDTRELWNLPEPDRDTENNLKIQIRLLLQALEEIEPALEDLPERIGYGYAYWAHPFARAVHELLPGAVREQHAALAKGLTALVAMGRGLPPRALPETTHKQRKVAATDSNKDAAGVVTGAGKPTDRLEAVGRLVRAVCYYLYESQMYVDFSWDAPKRKDSGAGADLEAAKHTSELLICVSAAFGFSVPARRLRRHLRDYGKMLRAEYSLPDARNVVQMRYRLSSRSTGKRRGRWRAPVIGDLGGVVVQVMLADAESQAAAANQSSLGPGDAAQALE